MNAMFEGTFAGRDGRPQHGRKGRAQSGQLRHGAVFDQTPDVGHLAGIEQRMDDFPIGRVPADQEDLWHR